MLNIITLFLLTEHFILIIKSSYAVLFFFLIYFLAPLSFLGMALFPLSAALGGRSLAACPGFGVVLPLFLVSRVHLLGCLGQNVGVHWLVFVGLLDHRQDCPALEVRAGGAARQELFRLHAVVVFPVLLENLQIKKDVLGSGR